MSTWWAVDAADPYAWVEVDPPARVDLDADPYWWVDLGPRCEVTELHRVACACRHCRNLPDPVVEMGTTWNEVRP